MSPSPCGHSSTPLSLCSLMLSFSFSSSRSCPCLSPVILRTAEANQQCPTANSNITGQQKARARGSSGVNVEKGNRKAMPIQGAKWNQHCKRLWTWRGMLCKKRHQRARGQRRLASCPQKSIGQGTKFPSVSWLGLEPLRPHQRAWKSRIPSRYAPMMYVRFAFSVTIRSEASWPSCTSAERRHCALGSHAEGGVNLWRS